MLREVNNNWRLAHVFYFYGDLTYCMVYEIMSSYKNYLDKPKSETHE